MMRAIQFIGSLLAPEAFAIAAFVIIGLAMAGAFYLFIAAWFSI